MFSQLEKLPGHYISVKDAFSGKTKTKKDIRLILEKSIQNSTLYAAYKLFYNIPTERKLSVSSFHST